MKREVNPTVCRGLNFSGTPRRREFYVMQQMVKMKAHTLLYIGKTGTLRKGSESKQSNGEESQAFVIGISLQYPLQNHLCWIICFFSWEFVLFLNAALPVWFEFALVGDASHLKGGPVRQSNQFFLSIQCYCTYALTAHLKLFLDFSYIENKKNMYDKLKVPLALNFVCDSSEILPLNSASNCAWLVNGLRMLPLH